MSEFAPPWAWRFTDAAGRELDRPTTPDFAGRFDAEEWLGVHWRVLRDQGVTGARLRHDGTGTGPVHDLSTVPERMTFRPDDD